MKTIFLIGIFTFSIYLLPSQTLKTIEGVSPIGSLDFTKIDSEPNVQKRKDRALIFATADYSGKKWPKLNNALDDGKALAEVLETKFGFEVEIVSNPSKLTIEKKMREYARKSYGKRDQLLIFFSGHGDKDEDYGTGYLVPLLATNYNEYFSHADFLGKADKIPSPHTLVIADACFSGLFTTYGIGQRSNDEPKRGSRLYRGKADHEFIEAELEKRTRIFLTSGSEEVPDGIKGSHTPFMRRILEALEGNLGGDNFLEFSELHSAVKKMQVVEPKGDSFGSNQPGSNFLFVLKQR